MLCKRGGVRIGNGGGRAKLSRFERIVQIETPKSAPQYELRVRRRGPEYTKYEIRQVPAEATPQVKSAVRLAGLRGAGFRTGRAPGAAAPCTGEDQTQPRFGCAKTRISGYRGSRACARAHVPHAGADAQPRKHAHGRRRDRVDGAGVESLLARHGDATSQTAARAGGADDVADGTASRAIGPGSGQGQYAVARFDTANRLSFRRSRHRLRDCDAA